MHRTDEVDALDPGIKCLVCMRCWDTVFSSESFRNLWEQSAEGIRITEQSNSSQDLYNYPLTYRTPPWAEILESADACCGYCTLIRDTRRTLPSEPSAGEVLVITTLFDLESTIQRIRITIWYGDSFSSSTPSPKETSIYADPDDPAAQYIRTRNVLWKVDDNASYRLALKCIADCSLHERCPQPVLTTLPTRVLDCSNPLRLRLITTDSSTKAYFVALSYVWGEPQLHCTTMENIDTYSDSIDLSTIPKTIIDAVTTTRGLGLRYLWVDSFCIVQDSEEDKAREISKMRLNFRNAFITIVSARAHAVSEGFLHNTYPSLKLKPVRLPFRCPDGTMGTIIVFRHGEILEPVDSRAWCLEERVLSSRLLVFSTCGLQYECQTSRVNVNGSPLGLPLTVPRLPDFAFTAEPGQVAGWQLDMCWDIMLQQYTASGLTNEEDKLLAIAGIAEQLHRLWPQSRYVAGMWTHQLPSALLWQQQGDDLRERPNAYRAPSWSWAAVDGKVAPRAMSGNTDVWRLASEATADGARICVVKNIAINLKHDGNLYGEVTSAQLILSADIVRATWNTQNDVKPRVLLPKGNSLLITNHRGLDSVGFIQLDALEIPDFPVAEVTLAGVAKHTVPMPLIARLGQHDIYGLMLVPADKRGGDVIYRRIGTFEMNAEAWFPISRQDIRIV